MKKIKITFADKTTIEVEESIKPFTLINRLKTDKDENKKMLAVLVNNKLCSLEDSVDISANLEAVYEDSKLGSLVYRRSLCFLLAAACHNIYPQAHLLVGHSLGYGYYYTLSNDIKLPSDYTQKLTDEMNRLIKEDLPIKTNFISYEEACTLFEKLNLTETRKQLNFHCPDRIEINTLEEFSDLYFGPLAPSTSCLHLFELRPYHEGFLLRFPAKSNTEKLTEFKDEPKLFEIYRRYKNWGKRLNVTSAASLNELIHNRKQNEFIDISETLQTKCIAEIAQQIADKKTAKVVLIAGPSSSGKTTTSKKLALQLQALGYRPKVISLDNYYVGRERNPKDENGNYDYECLEALDIELLNNDLLELFKGNTVDIPSYNFDKGERYYNGKKMQLEENDILIMEGIHGLNDKLTPLIPPEKKFKIYLSALTQLNLDDHNRIATSDNRLIRRIVRDAKFRGKSAAATISMWENVQKGERLHIFPFQNNADAMLNTALDYELPVLKVYATPLLRCVTPLQKEYAEAQRLLDFLNYFSQIPATAVPDHSIIREFIGGSAFKY